MRRLIGLCAYALYTLALAVLAYEIARWSARRELRLQKRGKLHTLDFSAWSRDDAF